MSLGAQQARLRESVADLNALDRLNGHQGCSKLRIKTTIRLNVSPYPNRNIPRHDFNDSANGIASGSGFLDTRQKFGFIILNASGSANLCRVFGPFLSTKKSAHV